MTYPGMSEEESIQYDVDEINMKREHQDWLDELDELDKQDNECEGHESLRGDKMGESDFCDGSCISRN